MIHVLVFIDFKYYSFAQFATVEVAREYARGLKRGYMLRKAVVKDPLDLGPILYTAVLPEDQDEMSTLIPEAELARAQEAIRPSVA